jgi:hypothetical protein
MKIKSTARKVAAAIGQANSLSIICIATPVGEKALLGRGSTMVPCAAHGTRNLARHSQGLNGPAGYIRMSLGNLPLPNLTAFSRDLQQIFGEFFPGRPWRV